MEDNHENCLNWWSQNNTGIKITEAHFERMSKFLGIDETRLFDGNYDRELARKRIYGDYSSLPERYMEKQHSFLRGSAHILRYVTLTRGQAFADQVLTSLNLSPLLYQNPNSSINLTYFADLLVSLQKKGFSAQEMDTLASVLFLSLQETDLGRKFQITEEVSDIYKVLAENFGYFDSNFEYKSSFVKKKYVLETTLPLQDHPLLKDDPEHLQSLIRYRHILLAWFPFLGGMNPIFPKSEVTYTSDTVKITYECDMSLETKPRRELRAL
jgi:hypothetical protein